MVSSALDALEHRGRTVIMAPFLERNTQFRRVPAFNGHCLKQVAMQPAFDAANALVFGVTGPPTPHPIPMALPAEPTPLLRLAVDATSVLPGQTVNLRYTMPHVPMRDTIVVVGKGMPVASPLYIRRHAGAFEGSVELDMPMHPGTYVIKWFVGREPLARHHWTDATHQSVEVTVRPFSADDRIFAPWDKRKKEPLVRALERVSVCLCMAMLRTVLSLTVRVLLRSFAAAGSNGSARFR